MTGNMVASLRVAAMSLVLCLVLLCSNSIVQAVDSWPMLAHDPGRSGATSTEIRPPFQRKWYRLFPDEGLMAGTQPIIEDGKVFIGTMRGTLHAMNDTTGEDIWAFKTPGAILHTCAVAGNKVFFGNAEGKVYAVDIDDGKLAWSVLTGAAIWNSPVVYQGVVLIGSRDGKVYAIDAESGRIKWATQTSGPLLSSPAVDVKAARVYIGCEDMCVYAFDLVSGRQLWRSNKLPGVSFRGYYPVVAPDGSIMVTVTPALSLDSFNPILHDMVKEIFGDFASWRHTKEENAKLRQQNFERMKQPGTYEAQLDYIRKRLTDQPAYQTFFVLDGGTGKQKFVAPIVYAESMNGTGAPPVVTADGKVIVKFRALLRSRYEHYSPFLNVGYLDTSTGHITPIMDQTRTYGWHDSLLLVHDEQCQLVVAGRVLINTHQDNVNAMDLDTLKGYTEPFCRNIHEPKPREAAGIWAMLLRGQTLPVGKEWLQRGTAVYGGGSVIDMPVSVAGDSFYYIPTHEINAGAAVIAYRMKTGGNASKVSEVPAADFTDDEWKKIQQLPWDWDTGETPRLNNLRKSLPGKVPGTRQQPLTESVAEAVGRIADDELDRFIWETPTVEFVDTNDFSALRTELSRSVKELISKDWQPFVFPPGKHPRVAYRFFIEPTEILLTLAQAYEYLDSTLQQEVRQYVERMRRPGGALNGPTGQRTFEPDKGEIRSLYDISVEKLFRVNDDIIRQPITRLYPLWLWAHMTGDWSGIENNWERLKELVAGQLNKMEEDCHNGYLAGLIAYCRIARWMNDDAVVEKALAMTRAAIRERLVFELAHTRGGLITQVPVSRSIFSRWRNLTPEIGRFCSIYAGQIHKDLMDVYVDYHRPTWYLAWGVETMWRNECPFAFPTMPAEVFAAKALILHESAEKLTSYLDIPWCKADLFYIQKLVLCIEAYGNVTWQN
ncbi:MAG: PQQ-like beta-propeller repeat protein [Sedimentisphaerales bacterium]|nr:PQQ-like beta-propeller repeat protein [Sedimentisphaerales bacterium]